MTGQNRRNEHTESKEKTDGTSRLFLLEYKYQTNICSNEVQ